MVEQAEYKLNYYENLIGGFKPDAVFILSGGTVKRERGYSTSAYSDTQGNYGVLGGKARIIAAAELSKYFHDTNFIMTGGYYPNEGDPSQSGIMSNELIRLGVPENRINTEDFSQTTIHELSKAVVISSTRDYKAISFLTNAYHIPRARGMLLRLGELAPGRVGFDIKENLIDFNANIKYSFISAEDILIQRSPHYYRLISRLMQEPDYHARLQSELNGILALKSGTYGKSK